MRAVAGPGAGETTGAAWHIGRPNLQRKGDEGGRRCELGAGSALAELLSTRILDLHTRHTQTILALCRPSAHGPRKPKRACSLARLQASTISENSWNLPASRKQCGRLQVSCALSSNQSSRIALESAGGFSQRVLRMHRSTALQLCRHLISPELPGTATS